MAGIAGICKQHEETRVSQMLDQMIHRGSVEKNIISTPYVTMGIIWAQHEDSRIKTELENMTMADGAGHGRMAMAQVNEDGFILSRDELGVAPLYYGMIEKNVVAFASEVKALIPEVQNIKELQPGHTLSKGREERYFQLSPKPFIFQDADTIANTLRQLMEKAIQRCIQADFIGSWLSGGLDSSSIAALARPHIRKLYTFCAGLPGAPDLEAARQVAGFIRSDHHEVIVTLPEIITVLPDVIRHLESFDALLVRSSITNYLVARAASNYVGEVFSGEGGDEFFAGYLYLKNLNQDALSEELIDIAGRLHNTALQRVDRSASAHGTTAHVIFADPEVFDYALQIPVGLKMHDGIEKWILRKALEGFLPDSVLRRTKAKFWEGTGMGTILAEYASTNVSDRDFQLEKLLPNGWILQSKEELMYYRFFREHFGSLENLDWMGRTKGISQQ